MFNALFIFQLLSGNVRKQILGNPVVTVEFNGRRMVILWCDGYKCDTETYVQATTEVNFHSVE